VPPAKPPASAPRPRPRRRTGGAPTRDVARILDEADASLLDVVDNLLHRGVVLRADVIIGLAGVDLIYLRLAAILCAAGRVLPRDAS
jgi:hypothetical protein